MKIEKTKNIVNAAERLAKRLHKDQVDETRVDYFSRHLTTVAPMGTTWQKQEVGYLHNASEDTPHVINEAIGILDAELRTPLPDADREELTTALRLLYHHTAPDRETYIRSIGTNALATAVKLHVLTHNINLSCLPNPTEKDLARVERYKKEYDYLNNIVKI